ncbi:LPS assembly lipoprotein LptE [Sagittula sp. SSi028]|uniref:LPS assembly lipoprotein LptE n=1 Tax=Sagittula sp. SSi028 TaxID=3400636 RepID=UPI003AF897CB
MTRRALLVVAAASLAACGFTPVYGPQGAGGVLLGNVDLPEARGDAQYEFNLRFEDRLGRADADALFGLATQLQMTSSSVGINSDGSSTRTRLIGRAVYTLRETATGRVLHEGRTTAFTGYSTTGTTVATTAASRDARERLMSILADQVVDDLLLHSSDLDVTGSGS